MNSKGTIFSKKKMDETIINPAPAQFSIDGTANQGYDRELADMRTRNGKIEDLKQTLRLIRNISQSLNEYMQFQETIDPKIRVILDVNQWTILILSGKAALTTIIDNYYSGITNPPEGLIIDVEEAHNNIENLVGAFTSSMAQIVSFMQSQLLPTPLPKEDNTRTFGRRRP